ncbi:hypothetical protein PF010_g963 [Phytophthora fragariae]|uniref:Uncharacterized protein n=1 Tax=Phytophthora fragariae TaxID=53985 RepID=A0A6A3FWM8_9STRA|nr:hypothetical protein PF003_g27977 [Phytophthora fragariae]KAE8949313.1 hypothetical protein PF009_g1124 [Phytophthora fragariae]KAE9028601.1 hypothetical protein PF011_g1490 [Phytophthora fragariae]KAE9138458.1 hypothetical protein PF010_g963 [Phytophthora fragariae]KAE9139572.1 hypothetical protein PF007_g974 [Phytophthora fragariae]
MPRHVPLYTPTTCGVYAARGDCEPTVSAHRVQLGARVSLKPNCAALACAREPALPAGGPLVPETP